MSIFPWCVSPLPSDIWRPGLGASLSPISRVSPSGASGGPELVPEPAGAQPGARPCSGLWGALRKPLFWGQDYVQFLLGLSSAGFILLVLSFSTSGL